MKSIVRIVLSFSFFCSLTAVHADVVLPPPNLNSNFFPYEGRVSAWGFEGSRGVGEGDVMLPWVGNPDTIFFSDVQGKYATDDSSMVSPGIGIRHIVNDERILGAYVFADHNESNQSQIFWDISPGLESIGNIWDFRVNGYIPVGNYRKLAVTEFADYNGTNSFVQFQGHTQFDELVNVYDEVGAGFDGEIGRTVPLIKNLRAFAGGYYFSPEDAESIRGAEGRLEYQAKSYLAFEAEDSYDNFYHNAAQFGIRVSLGGVDPNQTNTTIQNRILDPIARNLGTIYSGAGIPIEKGTQNLGRNIERDNIYFFTTNGGSPFVASLGTNNCTFEHPCAGGFFNQSTLSAINGFSPNANMYLSPGTYSALPTDVGLDVFNGQSIYGRTWGYASAAQGSGRPLLIGGIDALGNNILDSFQLINNNGSQAEGVEINATSNVFLNNLLVGSNTNELQSYFTAVGVTDSTNIGINNSTLQSFHINPMPILNTLVIGNSNVIVTNSTITANLFQTQGSFVSTPTANAVMMSGGNLILYHDAVQSSVLAISANPNEFLLGQAHGVSLGDDANLAVVGGSIQADASSTATGTNSFAFARAVGIRLTFSPANITLDNANITADATAHGVLFGQASTTGVFTGFVPDVILNMFGGSISATSNSSLANTNTSNATAVSSGGTVTIRNATLFASANSVATTGASTANAIGIDTTSGSTLTVNNSSLNTSAIGSAGVAGSTTVTSTGINLGGDSSITNNIFNISAISTGTANGSTSAYGIFNNGGTINQSGNTFNFPTFICSTTTCTQMAISP